MIENINLRKFEKDIKNCKTFEDKKKISQKYQVSISEIEFRQYILQKIKRR